MYQPTQVHLYPIHFTHILAQEQTDSFIGTYIHKSMDKTLIKKVSDNAEVPSQILLMSSLYIDLIPLSSNSRRISYVQMLLCDSL